MRLLAFFYFFDIVRSALVYEIVQPIRKEQMRVPTPRNERGLADIVVWEVVDGDFNRFSLRQISKIFVFQGVRVVFRMARDKDLPSVFRGKGIYARILRRGENFQFFYLFDIF